MYTLLARAVLINWNNRDIPILWHCLPMLNPPNDDCIVGCSLVFWSPSVFTALCCFTTFHLHSNQGDSRRTQMVARRPPQSGSTHLSANKSNLPLQLTRTLVTSNAPSTVPTLKWRNGEGVIKSFLNSLVAPWLHPFHQYWRGNQWSTKIGIFGLCHDVLVLPFCWVLLSMLW